MDVIFLDVDGVLNNRQTTARTPEKYIGVDDMLIDNLKYIVKNTGAEIVLSSDWKFEYDRAGKDHGTDMKYLIKHLAFHGLSIMDVTDGRSRGDNGRCHRGAEIADWLLSHLQVKHWVVIDDVMFEDFNNEEIKRHLVLTSEYTSKGRIVKGLTRELAEDAVYILRYIT